MKILVISSNLIGDTILSSGVIQHFLSIYPKSKVTFVIGPTAKQIYEHFPNLERIIVIKKKKFSLHWLEIFSNCFFAKWDIIIDFRSSIISYFLLNRKKYIFKKDNRYHQLDQLKNYFKFNCSNLNIYNNDKEKEEANIFIVDNYKHVVLSPGGNWPPKIWSAKKFNELIKLINTCFKNVKFVIVGSISEKNKFYDDVVKDINKDQIINLMGKSLTLTSAFMKKSDLFIGNDSGLMHLSVASHLKTIGLFGPTNDKIYGPIGKNCFVIRTEESYDYFKQSIQDTKRSYMDTINVKKVMNLIQNNDLLK